MTAPRLTRRGEWLRDALLLSRTAVLAPVARCCSRHFGDPMIPADAEPNGGPVRTAEPGKAALIAQPEPAPYTESGEAATKTRVVSVRFTEAEFAALTALAAERGITPSKALRLAWFLIERLEATAHV